MQHIHSMTTLENFDTQKDLSCRQLRWQEFMLQYDLTITYIRGEDNTMADALSRLPPNCFPNEIAPMVVDVILTIDSDRDIFNKIKAGYLEDEFCICVAKTAMKGWTKINDSWYIGDCLLIP